MIQNRKDLIEYKKADMPFYHRFSLKEKYILRIIHDPSATIVKYIRALRNEEYYFNCRKDFLGKIMGLMYLRKKNLIGNKIGLDIPRNTFEKGLTIYHNGIIVNDSVRVGEYAVLHGCNCIGNDGLSNDVPIIGDRLDMGYGSTIIGNISLGNNITVGAGAVVIDSFGSDNTIAGVPASIIR